MEITERSFSGKQFRSRCVIEHKPDYNLLLILTPWGDRSAAQTAIDTIEKHFLNALQDLESTSPFGKIESLSESANHLRVAIMLANDAVFQNHNREQYLAGVEILALHYSGEEIVWTQVGQPSMLLSRTRSPHLHVLSSQFDLAWNYSTGGKFLAPLPSQLLGMHRQSNISLQSFRPQAGDQLFFLSRSDFPGQVLSLAPEQRTLDKISSVLAADNKEKPFWLAQMQL